MGGTTRHSNYSSRARTLHPPRKRSGCACIQRSQVSSPRPHFPVGLLGLRARQIRSFRIKVVNLNCAPLRQPVIHLRPDQQRRPQIFRVRRLPHGHAFRPKRPRNRIDQLVRAVADHDHASGATDDRRRCVPSVRGNPDRDSCAMPGTPCAAPAAPIAAAQRIDGPLLKSSSPGRPRPRSTVAEQRRRGSV